MFFTILWVIAQTLLLSMKIAGVWDLSWWCVLSPVILAGGFFIGVICNEASHWKDTTVK